jgi:hypothetical protein
MTTTESVTAETAPAEPTTEQILAEINADFAAEDAASDAQKTEAGTGEQQSSPASAAGAKDKQAPSPDSAKALMRVQQRLAAREAKLAEAERALRDKTRLTDTPAGKTEWTNASIKSDPMGFLKAQGLDPGLFGRAVLAEEFGENAPEGYRKIASDLKREGASGAEIEALKREIGELRSQVTTREQDSSTKSYVDGYYQQIDAHLAGDLTDSPAVATLMARDKGKVMEEIRNLVAADASRKLQTGGTPMTPAQAVAAFNERMSWIISDGGSRTKPRLTNQQPIPRAPDGDSLEESAKAADEWLRSIG